jgi:hypothetical protein
MGITIDGITTMVSQPFTFYDTQNLIKIKVTPPGLDNLYLKNQQNLILIVC